MVDPFSAESFSAEPENNSIPNKENSLRGEFLSDLKTKLVKKKNEKHFFKISKIGNFCKK